ncbi:hypothetical protein D3C73_1630750 [compost metagenome]
MVQSLMGRDSGMEPAERAKAVLSSLDDDKRVFGGTVTTAIFSKLQKIPAVALP